MTKSEFYDLTSNINKYNQIEEQLENLKETVRIFPELVDKTYIEMARYLEEKRFYYIQLVKNQLDVEL